jgi:TolB-like protein/tetratricopeptide (TPR) repeat protein
MTAESGIAGHLGASVSVFLSYSREDRPVALKVIAALEAGGCDVWWDGLLQGGVAFARKTEDALEKADVVLVLWSARSVVSHWVRDEATYGRQHQRLVPASIDGSAPPLGFGQYQVLDLSKWRGKANAPEIVALLRAINIAKQPSDDALDRAPSPVGLIARRRFLVISGGVATATALGGVAAWKLDLFARKNTANSVAVLPFNNLSGDPAQVYFSDGLSEEVRTALARNSQLKVVAQASANMFRDRKVSAPEIASKLGVAYLLGGSVRRAGDVVRIAAELIDGKTGFATWTQSFDRKMIDIFAIQSEIANTVASALSDKVAPSHRPKPGVPSGTGGTANVLAYDAYLRGLNLYNYGTGEDSDRMALAQFDAAIAADPNYAAAYAIRSRTLAVIASQYSKVEDLHRLNADALTTAKKAVALAPDLAEGHAALGDVLFSALLDAKSARMPFDRAIALGMGEASVNARYARYCALTGRASVADEAILRAVSLDPLNPLVHRSFGRVRYAAHRYSDSIVPLRRALELNPGLNNIQAQIGDALLMLGRNLEARAAYVLEPQGLSRLPGLAIVERKLDNGVAAEAAKAMLLKDLGDSALYQQAQIAAQWGDNDGALKLLERARAFGDSGLVFLRTDPLLDPLRNNPQFSRLQNDIGLA